MSNRTRRSGGCHGISDLLAHPRAELGVLVGKARGLVRLQRMLGEILDPAVCAHFQVAGVAEGVLTLLADSPAWATRLRYLSAVITEQLAGRDTPPVRTVRIISRPAAVPRPVPAPRQAVMSAQAAATLTRAAQTVDDPRLRDALRRLARRNNSGA